MKIKRWGWGGIALVFLAACSEPNSGLDTDPVRRRTQAIAEEVPMTAEQAAALEEPEAPFDETVSADIDSDGSIVGIRKEHVPSRISLAPASLKTSTTSTAKATQFSKVSPELEGTGNLNVSISYSNPVRIPRLPRLRPDQPRTSSENSAILGRIQRLVNWVQHSRSAIDVARIEAIIALGGTVESVSWLTGSISGSLPADNLTALAVDPEILSIDPTTGGTPTASHISDGRSMLNSDPYFNTGGLNGGYVGIVDTGIRASHIVFGGRLSWVRDCYNGQTNNCGTPGAGLTLDPSDQRPSGGHGTGTANIMSGNSSLAPEYRGVTQILLDSFRATNSAGTPNYPAVDRSFQAALAGGDDVVNMSMDCSNSQCIAPANAAFDSGAVVVASMGNSNTTYAAYPARAKKVLGVGAIGTDGLRWNDGSDGSNMGPTPDGRVKPDLVALGIDTYKASSAGDSEVNRRNGTSIAAPFVSGAAALMVRWLKISFGTSPVEPGQTYAILLAAGTNYSSPGSDQEYGAGSLRLPTSATLTGRKMSVGNQQNVDTSINVSASGTLDVGIWWPEPENLHNDIDLSIQSPSGSWTSSSSGPNVWEKLRITTVSGTYTIRARGYSVSGSQTVYLGAIRR